MIELPPQQPQAAEIQFLTKVNTDLRANDNILLFNSDAQKLELGSYVCKELKTKSLLELNLLTYSRLIKEPSAIRFKRYMQWYSTISTNAVKYLCQWK